MLQRDKTHLVDLRDVIDHDGLGFCACANSAVQVGNAHLNSMLVIPPQLLQ